ncbi:MAG TPA: hypothetical protein VIM77_10225 [Mucilaginibacter sp.]
MKSKVTLQINLAPGDYPHVRHLLKHQLNTLAGQVDEVSLTIDTRPSKGRFGKGWDAYRELLNKFITGEIEPAYEVKIAPVDYGTTIKERVARYFFGSGDVPDKDFRGGPFYAYFFGLYTASNNLVFHLDSDMFLGGLSQTWISEAVQHFEADPSCFIVSPLPGPPATNDTLTGQSVITKVAAYTWQLEGMSTRIFMMDKSRFEKHKLSLAKPSSRNQVKALIQGNANADLPEHLISAYMGSHHLKRIDFLGTGKGLWSLHPPYRTKAFYDNLPHLISRVESNDLPEEQHGFYDIIDLVCDWTEAKERLKQNRWWKKNK